VTKVVETFETPPTIVVAAHATVVAGLRRQNKQRHSRKHVTIRSIDWKLVDSIFEPLHARFDFILEGCVNDEGLNLRGDLPHCSPIHIRYMYLLSIRKSLSLRYINFLRQLAPF
jgi:hypothetical protein